jgi:hypothetical protein
MYPARAGMVFVLIIGMCVLAGLLAMASCATPIRRMF